MALASEAVRDLLALLEASRAADLEAERENKGGLALLYMGRAEAFADAINWIRVADR